MSTKFRITVSVCLALVLILGASVIAFGNTGGSSVYAQYCAGCHGGDGQGTAYGPDIQGESTGEVIKVTRSGDDEMPGLDSSVISDADLAVLAAYVAGLPGSGAPGDQYGDGGSSGDEVDHGSSDDAAANQYNLELVCGTVYWASWDDYANHLLSVDYGITNTGSGSAYNVEVVSATGTNGVTAALFTARKWDRIAPGEVVNFTIKWLVPPNVTGFISTLEVCSSCSGDDDSADDESADDESGDDGSRDDSSGDDKSGDHRLEDHRSGDDAGEHQYGIGERGGSRHEGSRDEGSKDD